MQRTLKLLDDLYCHDHRLLELLGTQRLTRTQQSELFDLRWKRVSGFVDMYGTPVSISNVRLLVDVEMIRELAGSVLLSKSVLMTALVGWMLPRIASKRSTGIASALQSNVEITEHGVTLVRWNGRLYTKACATGVLEFLRERLGMAPGPQEYERDLLACISTSTDSELESVCSDAHDIVIYNLTRRMEVGTAIWKRLIDVLTRTKHISSAERGKWKECVPLCATERDLVELCSEIAKSMGRKDVRPLIARATGIAS